MNMWIVNRSSRNVISLLVVVVSIVCSGCKGRDVISEGPGRKPDVGRDINSQAFQDVMSTLGEKIEQISQLSEKQNRALEQSIKDYAEDRKRFQGLFDQVADRLDKVDKSLGTLRTDYNSLIDKVDGLTTNNNSTEGK